MSSKSTLNFMVLCLLVLALAGSGWISSTLAADYLEEFDNDALNPDRWEIKAAGSASYKIENGQLIMTSPGVSDGILLYWRGSDTEKEDLSVEIKAQVAPNTNNAAVIAFIKNDIQPTSNDVINGEWKSVFWCGQNSPGWYINDDNWERSGAAGPELEGTWKAEILGDKINCYFNGDKVVNFSKVTEDRFLCFGPDVYTSHYSGEITIDWIRLSGDSVEAAAVNPAEKLSTSWGRVKSLF